MFTNTDETVLHKLRPNQIHVMNGPWADLTIM